MKIGLVIYGSLDTLSGGYMYDRKLVEYLQAQGDAVDIISLPWRNYAAHLTDNFSFTLPKGLDILIEDELNHPSLIFANRKPHPYPIISLVHHLRSSEKRPNWQNFFYRALEKKYLNTVDGFIFNSQTTQSVVDELLKAGKPSIVAYPPTDRFGNAISESDIIQRAKTSELRILFLGNVIERKGLLTLLKALKNTNSNVRLDIVGSLTLEENYSAEIQKFIIRNDLSSIISLHNSLNNAPLVEKMQRAHVLIVPSSYEGFGIVYIEGMCFGLPAIGTTAGAASEVIEHGKTGYLIEPENHYSLVEYINELAQNREKLVELSLNARQRYERQPKWGKTAKTVRNFLLKMI